MRRQETHRFRGWREATEEALYGSSGFYRRPEGPAGHFRTSVHASPLFAGAVARLLCRVDEALDRPASLAFVDMAAGRGELVTAVLAALPAEVASRARGYAVERAARPAGLDHRIEWLAEPPAGVTGLLFANEWLDNVPVEVAELDPEGVARVVLVRQDGTERLGEPVQGADARWLRDWWPLSHEGARAEIGLPRDVAWASAVASLRRGLAVAVDYAHLAGARPPFGTLTGFREGRETAPVPDGSCDITAHVALDACAASGGRVSSAGRVGTGEGVVTGDGVASAGREETDERIASEGRAVTGEHAAAARRKTTGEHAAAARREATDERITPEALEVTREHTGVAGRVVSQREALRALGVSGARPALALASTDPAAYVRALASAGAAAELTAPGGLGDFGWLLQPVGPAVTASLTGLGRLGGLRGLGDGALLVDVPDHEEQ